MHIESGISEKSVNPYLHICAMQIWKDSKYGFQEKQGREGEARQYGKFPDCSGFFLLKASLIVVYVYKLFVNVVSIHGTKYKISPKIHDSFNDTQPLKTKKY